MKIVLWEVREINVRELLPIFVWLQCWVLAALFFERYVRHFGSLHPAFEMSCDTEYLEKTAFDFFGNLVFVVLDCVQLFWWFSYKTVRKIMGHLAERKTPTFQNDVEYVPQVSVWALLFSLVVTKKMFWELPEVSLLGTIRVFCSNAESRFGCAGFRRLGLVLWLFASCVWDVLRYRILIKTALFSWGKQRNSKTTLSTFQKCLFDLCSAGLFGCK